jgi:rhodanese-related sulfurtransferase
MWGMCSWATDANVTAGKCFNMTAHSHEYAFSTGIWDGEVREEIYGSLNPMKTVAITADSLYDNLWDGDTSNDPFILSIRKSDAYELGHIPGAVNYGGIGGLFTDENLAKLPYDNQIVVVCYTGHTASQAAALLNLLGFNATALKWGMVGWCANTTIAPMGFTRTTPNYPIITGSEPGTIDEAEEATI